MTRRVQYFYVMPKKPVAPAEGACMNKWTTVAHDLKFVTHTLSNNSFLAKLSDLNFHPLEVMSRYATHNFMWMHMQRIPRRY